MSEDRKPAAWQKVSFWLSRYRWYRFAAYEFAFLCQFLSNSWVAARYEIKDEWDEYRDTVTALKIHDRASIARQQETGKS